MGFVGRKPTNAPLVSSDLGTGIVGSTNIADNAVLTGKIADNAVLTGKIANGTITLDDLSATGTKDATTFLRGDNTFAEAGGGVNTPAFLATLSADQSISNSTLTKVQFNTEVFDTNSNYDNATNYRFTPTTAGKYFVYATVWAESNNDSNYSRGYALIQKNGTTTLVQNSQDSRDNATGAYSSSPMIVVSMNGTTDYLEVKALIQAKFNGGILQINGGTGQSSFGAYKIIE